MFSYITKDDGLTFCHVFRTPKKEVSDDIVLTLGQAFEVAYQKIQRAKVKSANNSLSKSDLTEPAKPQRKPHSKGLTDEELKQLNLGPF